MDWCSLSLAFTLPRMLLLPRANRSEAMAKFTADGLKQQPNGTPLRTTRRCSSLPGKSKPYRSRRCS
eukprot:3936150-Rhodomonas_salina.3